MGERDDIITRQQDIGREEGERKEQIKQGCSEDDKDQAVKRTGHRAFGLRTRHQFTHIPKKKTRKTIRQCFEI